MYSVNMRENAPWEAEIILEVMDIEDPLIVERLGCLNEGPGSIIGRKGQRLITRLCTESKRHPLPTDKKLAT